MCLLVPRFSWAEESPFRCFVSILPLKTFVEKVGGGKVEVHVLVPPGSSPATYEPSPRQMALLAESRLFFRVGVPFESAFLPKLKRAMENLEIVDLREGIQLERLEEHRHEGHSPQREGHSHEKEEALDPHIWTSPPLVKIQARHIAKALKKARPEGEAFFEERLRAFQAELDQLHENLREALAPLKGKAFLVFHPAWGYFARTYGLKQIAIESEGKSPTGRQLARIVDKAEEENIQVIFVQPQFSQSAAEQLAQSIDGVVIPLDPLAANYVENMEKVAKTLKERLK